MRVLPLSEAAIDRLTQRTAAERQELPRVYLHYAGGTLKPPADCRKQPGHSLTVGRWVYRISATF